MHFVSVTRLRVRSRRYMPGFLIQSLRSALQAKRAAGSLAVLVLRDADRAFWTCTVWLDEAAMRSFMQSGVHRRVMVRLPEWCDEAALVHWVQSRRTAVLAGSAWTHAASEPAIQVKSPLWKPKAGSRSTSLRKTEGWCSSRAD